MRETSASIGMAVLVACAVTTAQGQEEEATLTSADIIALTEAGLSPSVIVTVIEAVSTGFDTTEMQLATLSQAGVDSAVIHAVVRARVPPMPVGLTFSDELSSGGEGPEMVVIPAGRFRMGCISRRSCYEDEKPTHDVAVPEAFAVSKYEVMFEDYDRFTYPSQVDDGGWGRDRRPVINVSWNDAKEYVVWLSRQTGQSYRLLSEAEWEYVARAGSSTPYSWGQTYYPHRANCILCDDRWQFTAPVGEFQANEFGVHDMHGNVWEWVEDCWNESYAGAPSDSSAWLSGDCNQRVLRGGSWAATFDDIISGRRSKASADGRYSGGGFRVARSLSRE